MYQLLFDKDFKKFFSKLNKKEKQRILEKLKELKIYPELGKHLIGIDLWSLRVGKFRILYKIIQDKLIILILTAEHRKSVYDNLKKRFLFK